MDILEATEWGFDVADVCKEITSFVVSELILNPDVDQVCLIVKSPKDYHPNYNPEWYLSPTFQELLWSELKTLEEEFAYLIFQWGLRPECLYTQEKRDWKLFKYRTNRFKPFLEAFQEVYGETPEANRVVWNRMARILGFKYHQGLIYETEQAPNSNLIGPDFLPWDERFGEDLIDEILKVMTDIDIHHQSWKDFIFFVEELNPLLNGLQYYWEQLFSLYIRDADLLLSEFNNLADVFYDPNYARSNVVKSLIHKRIQDLLGDISEIYYRKDFERNMLRLPGLTSKVLKEWRLKDRTLKVMFDHDPEDTKSLIEVSLDLDGKKVFFEANPSFEQCLHHIRSKVPKDTF